MYNILYPITYILYHISYILYLYPLSSILHPTGNLHAARSASRPPTELMA